MSGNTKKTTIPAAPVEPIEPEPETDAAKAEAKGAALVIEHEGVTFTMDREVLDDVELIERIGDFTDGQYSLLPSIMRAMLGREQWEAFKIAHRGEDGRIPTDAMDQLFNALNAALGE